MVKDLEEELHEILRQDSLFWRATSSMAFWKPALNFLLRLKSCRRRGPWYSVSVVGQALFLHTYEIGDWEGRHWDSNVWSIFGWNGDLPRCS
jgi:hypothetical protein